MSRRGYRGSLAAFGVRVWALRLGLVAVLVGAWMYGVGPGDVSPLLLPSIGDVAGTFASLVSTWATWQDVAVTLLEMVTAFGLSVAAGFVVGFVGSRTQIRAKVIEPLLAWGYMVPTVLFYPLFVLWFGVGIWSKILYATAVAFFPIAYNTMRGFQSVEERYLRVGRAFGASKLQTDLLIKFGAALPMVASGIRIGAALNMIGVILGEMLAGASGLGFELTRASQLFETSRAWALIVLILIIVAVIQSLIVRADMNGRSG